MADAQRTFELLTLTANENKIDADSKKDFYFKAHARALELAIAREDLGIDLNSACDDANGDLPTLEYENRTAGAAANRAETEPTNVTNKHQQLSRRLAKIKPKTTPEIVGAVTRIVILLSEMPVAMAENTRERGRATIYQLLSSYVRHKRGMLNVTSKAAPRAVPPATETPVSTSSANHLSSSQDPETITLHDFDVTMATAPLPLEIACGWRILVEGLLRLSHAPPVFLYERS